MGVVAKFNVASVKQMVGRSVVEMSPVSPSADDDRITREENEKFWQATPNGRIELHIDNPAAAEQFQAGDPYYVTFEPAD